MKAYEPRRLAAISAWNDFPSLPDEIRENVSTAYDELIEEEKEYCDTGNYKHMAQILTSIALCEVLQRHGRSEEEPTGPSRRRCGSSLTPPACRSGDEGKLFPASDEEDFY